MNLLMYVNVYSINFCKSLLGYSIGRTPDMPCICHSSLSGRSWHYTNHYHSINKSGKSSFFFIGWKSFRSIILIHGNTFSYQQQNQYKVEQGFSWVKHWRITFDWITVWWHEIEFCGSHHKFEEIKYVTSRNKFCTDR